MISNKKNLIGDKVIQSDGKVSNVQSYLRVWIALGVCTITLFSILLKSFLPIPPDYTLGFAPTWVTAFAAIMGMITLLQSISWRRER